MKDSRLGRRWEKMLDLELVDLLEMDLELVEGWEKMLDLELVEVWEMEMEMELVEV